MRIADIFKERATLSFEVFPPRTAAGMEKLCGKDGILEKLYTLGPDYISCTYGAGGTNVGNNVEVLEKIQTDGSCVPMTHFTCIGNTRPEIREKLQKYLDRGIDHILALRGDLPLGWSGTNGDLQYASELVELIRTEFADCFTVAVAGSPEGHVLSENMQADVAFLKQKQDCGADFIVSQLCWNMDQFCRWLEAIRAAGIWLPVDVGVMPVLDPAATINMALSRNGCVMDSRLCKLLSRCWIFPNPFDKNPIDADAKNKKKVFREEGIAYTVDQIAAYRACGIDGIHLYTLNRFEDVALIANAAGLTDRR